MGLADLYSVEPIGKDIAMFYVVTHHYLHRKSPCSCAFAMIERSSQRIVGVVIYGKPASDHLCRGICGDDEAENVLELNRLWIEDGTPRNSESYLIARSSRSVPAEILVSYADPSRKHVGIVYQASNWLYTGLSCKHVEWEEESETETVQTLWGEEPIQNHSRHWHDKYGSVVNAKAVLGELVKRKERAQKHRYVHFNCDRRRQKELMRKLRYPILPYPKADSKE